MADRLNGRRNASFLPSTDNQPMTSASSALGQDGFVWIRSAFATPAAAFDEAQQLIDECSASGDDDGLSVIGDFVVPPADGEATRDFQTLHFDFGVPLSVRCAIKMWRGIQRSPSPAPRSRSRR